MTLRGEPVLTITVRELEVLGAYVREGSMSRAARSLGLSTHTVDKHLEHVRAKLGVRTTIQAVNYLHAHGVMW